MKHQNFGKFLILIFCMGWLSLSSVWANNLEKEINWESLRGLDYQTGKMDNKLTQLNTQVVKIAGFPVPLSGSSMHSVKEFLLVPSAGMCIHVPPPPPNQLVHVILVEEAPIEDFFGPVWISGQLQVVNGPSEYGAAGFQMEGLNLESYEIPGVFYNPFQ